jgi:serpin B
MTMKKTILGLSLLPLLCAGGALGSGGGTDPAAAGNAFAVDLYARLGADGRNLFFSPASVVYALAMTRTGARGTTAAEMDKVLHFAPWDPDLAASFGDLMTRLTADRENAVLRLANRLYGQRGFGFRPEFISGLERNFGAGLAEVDFAGDAAAARGVINAWVSEQTGDRIRDLLPDGSLSAATRLVLVNAIYFLGDWRKPFPEDATQDAPFHRAAGGDVDVPFMHVTGTFGYAETDTVQILSLPYAGDDLDMVLVLPVAGTPLSDVESGLDAGTLAAWLAAPAAAEVEVALPRLHLETKFDMGKTLEAMGMRTAFTRAADFTGMTSAGNLMIDDVVHKAYLDVDEQGTEAAAATGVEMRLTSAVPVETRKFTADRPFILLIRHAASGAVLFLGRVADPA